MKTWILLGTRAEYIKLAALIGIFDSNKTEYILLETGQHFNETPHLRHQLSISNPDFVIRPMVTRNGLLGKIYWLLNVFYDIIFINYPKFRIDNTQKAIAIIQGDTLSTLMSFIFAKRHGFKIMHIESGLSSKSFFEPFPEEIIRRIVCKFSDFLIAPSANALNNLQKYRTNKFLYLTKANTGIDTCIKTLRKAKNQNRICHFDYVLVAIHRLENLYNPIRLKNIIKTLQHLLQSTKVIFIGYDNTINQLRRFKQGKMVLAHENVSLISPMDYEHFLNYLYYSKYVITDGGTIQEECSYMDIPCLILRRKSERHNGLNKGITVICPIRKNLSQVFDWMQTKKRNSENSNMLKEASKKIIAKYPVSPSQDIYNLLKAEIEDNFNPHPNNKQA